MSGKNPATNPPSPNVELEQRIMFQQRTLDELNGVVLQQQTEIDRLGNDLRALRTLFQQSLEQVDGDDLPYEKPPHY